MRIIVIGASGFIGAYLVDSLLRSNHEVLAVGRNEHARRYYKSRGVELISLNVQDEAEFSKLPASGVDAVVNLSAVIPAADCSLNGPRFLAVNTIGAYNSMMFCVNTGIPVHLLTTSHFAMEGHWGRWDSEHERISADMGTAFPYKGGHSAYIISKVAAEQYSSHFIAEYGLRCITYRLTGVHGFGRYESGFEFFVSQAKAGRDIEVFGDPSKVWDNIYVKDVTRAIELGLVSQKTVGLYLLASGIPLTLFDEVNAIADTFSPPGQRIKVLPKPQKPGGISLSYVYDVSPLKRDAGFEVMYPLNARHTLIDYKSELENGRFGWLRDLKEHQ
jgi:UDP-glucose 4-epimerase